MKCKVILRLTFFLLLLTLSASVTLHRSSQNNQMQLLISQKYLQSLSSIDAKLKIIDQSFLRHSSILRNKISSYEQKLDKVEKNLLNLSQIEKVLTEKMNKQQEREDALVDKITQKIDSFFEKVNTKYGNIENSIESFSGKIEDVKDKITDKLDEINESLNIRDEEILIELEETVTDLKKNCTTAENKIINRTEDRIKEIFKQEKIVSNAQINEISEIINSFRNNNVINNDSNCSRIELILGKNKLEIEESLNDFTNKVTDMNFNMEDTLEKFKQTLENVVTLVNVTSNERKNNLRKTKVTTSRKNEEQNFSNGTSDSEKLIEISNNIDKFFEKVVTAQNSFSENCYKIQKDESQIESKIVFILEILWNNIQNQTTVKYEEFQKFEKGLVKHNSYLRKHINELTKKINTLSNKITDNKIYIINAIEKLFRDKQEVLKSIAYNTDILVNESLLSNVPLEKSLFKIYEILEIISYGLNITTPSPNENFTFIKQNITNSNMEGTTTDKNNFNNSNADSTFYFDELEESTMFERVILPLDVSLKHEDETKELNSNEEIITES